MSTQPGPFVRAGEPLNDFLRSFWQRQVDAAEAETPDYRHPPLPLARIKKVMKSDPDVKVIAADAPILFCKACEIFISEITARAFIIADSNKRRTLSRSDISKALSKSDQFDFLIDIVPREELPFPAASSSTAWKKSQSAAAKPVNTAFFYPPPPYLYVRYPAQGPTPGPGDSPSNPLELDQGEGPTNVTTGSQVLEQLETLLNSGPIERPQVS
ncbi:histone-fold-containing protein [Collybia nuda]|uniref:Histone-fold-containing protein n=1 Tax=Collybia nuda TaxID=64659 RepID=A0A9P5XV53_9AGAR|nr:histone-fold-containing protein [Collybia nuda]